MTSLLWLASLTLVIFILSGCGGGVYQSSGNPAPAPDGYVQLCRDMPEYPSCK